MSKLSWFGVMMSFVLMLGGAARAEDHYLPSAQEWQTVIHAQIEAFRKHDAPTALSYASEEFHKQFTDPNAFFVAIISSGYSPIVESLSESFGSFELQGENEVFQEVRLTGTDQTVYEAIYELTHETAGWRVHGVQLIKTKAIGI
ncbi:MAG TPA: DUF4864 domain-containing protein [Devosia sp.]|jgi:hypothetical protein|nr:DUF4864 domain-containing protein [Devosia sp.]